MFMTSGLQCNLVIYGASLEWAKKCDAAYESFCIYCIGILPNCQI